MKKQYHKLLGSSGTFQLFLISGLSEEYDANLHLCPILLDNKSLQYLLQVQSDVSGIGRLNESFGPTISVIQKVPIFVFAGLSERTLNFDLLEPLKTQR